MKAERSFEIKVDHQATIVPRSVREHECMLRHRTVLMALPVAAVLIALVLNLMMD